MYFGIVLCTVQLQTFVHGSTGYNEFLASSGFGFVCFFPSEGLLLFFPLCPSFWQLLCVFCFCYLKLCVINKVDQ